MLRHRAISSLGAESWGARDFKPSAQSQSHFKRSLVFVALQQPLRVASTQIHDRVDDALLIIGEWQLGLVDACASLARIRPQTGSRRQLLRMILPPPRRRLHVTPDWLPGSSAGGQPTVSSLTAVSACGCSDGGDEEPGVSQRTSLGMRGASAYGFDLCVTTS